MPDMTRNEPSHTPLPDNADTMIERRHPSDVDRLRDVIGSDVLPFYRDEHAVAAYRQAAERWPHLVAVANSRAAH